MSHAAVFGASGLSGWAVVNQLLSGYPSQTVFNKVTAIVNRPIAVRDTFWPDPAQCNIKLQLATGVNLNNSSYKALVACMKEKIPDIDTVTHVYYFAYKSEMDMDEERRINGLMLQNAIDALCQLAPNLRFVSLLAGTRTYGTAMPERYLRPPFVESMSLPEPAFSANFHTTYRQILKKASKDRSWTWGEVRPDLIVGFHPTSAAFNMTAHWGRYLSTYALVHGCGARIPFPGIDAAYTCLWNEASAEIIAKLAIWISQHPSICGGGEAFNAADCDVPMSLETRWPALADYFGLVGISPTEGGIYGPEDVELPGVFMEKYKDVLEKSGVRAGGEVSGAQFLDIFGLYMTYDRQLSMEKVRAVGFTEQLDPIESWRKSWDMFRKAGILPVLE